MRREVLYLHDIIEALDSDELKKRHPEIPWPQIVAFRNILVHAYFGVDWTEVWQAATRQAPELRGQIAAILQSGFNHPNGAK